MDTDQSWFQILSRLHCGWILYFVRTLRYTGKVILPHGVKYFLFSGFFRIFAALSRSQIQISFCVLKQSISHKASNLRNLWKKFELVKLNEWNFSVVSRSSWCPIVARPVGWIYFKHSRLHRVWHEGNLLSTSERQMTYPPAFFFVVQSKKFERKEGFLFNFPSNRQCPPIFILMAD